MPLGLRGESNKMDKRKIVRTYSAGVFFGELVENSRSSDGKRGIIKNARRLFYWVGASSLSQLAVDGVCTPGKCKFPVSVPNIEVTEIIEILDVTKKAAKSIDGVQVWKQV